MSDVVVIRELESADALVIPSGPIGPTGDQGPAGDVAKAADRAALAGIAGATVGMVRALVESGREGTFIFDDSDLSTEVTADTQQGVYVPPSSDTTGASGAWVRKFDGAASAKWFGALGDGATDDTTALTAAFAASSKVHIPAGTFIVSSISIPANTDVTTAGHDTIIKQKSGTGANTRIIQFTGSNSSLGDISVEGQLDQAGDTTGEQNHGVFIQSNASAGDLSDITVGNVRGANIRGDVVYVGAAAGYTVHNVGVGKVNGSNVYRNVVTVSGGANGVSIESIDGEQVGLYHYDHEPNVGEGPSKGVRIGYIRGRNINAGAPDTASYIEGEYIGHFEYDPAIATSSPDYSIANPTVPTFTWPYPFQFRNVKSLTLGTANIASSPGAPVNHLWSAGDLSEQFISGDKWTISNCCQTTGVNYIAGSKGVTFLDLGELEVTLGASTHWAVAGCSKSRIGPVALTTLSTPTAASGLVSNCDDLAVGPVKHVAGTGGSLIGGACNRVQINGGSFAGDRLLSNTTDAILIGVVSTATTTNASSTAYFYGCSLAGTKYAFRYESASASITADTSGGLVTANGNVTLTGTGFFNTAVGYKVSSSQVVGARKTGWAVDTGTAKRTANATYSGTAEAAYTQATIQTLMNAVRDLSQTVKALKDDLHSTAGHGLIGT